MLKIFSNDKTTAKDEITLCIFDVIMLIIGVVLICLQVNSSITVFGVLALVTGIMFIPSIVWRLHENYKTEGRH